MHWKQISTPYIKLKKQEGKKRNGGINWNYFTQNVITYIKLYKPLCVVREISACKWITISDGVEMYYTASFVEYKDWLNINDYVILLLSLLVS